MNVLRKTGTKIMSGLALSSTSISRKQKQHLPPLGANPNSCSCKPRNAMHVFNYVHQKPHFRPSELCERVLPVALLYHSKNVLQTQHPSQALHTINNPNPRHKNQLCQEPASPLPVLRQKPRVGCTTAQTPSGCSTAISLTKPAKHGRNTILASPLG